MKSLTHICNNYISSKVHSELIKAIDNNNSIQQYVYVPVRQRKDQGVNAFESAQVKFEYFNYRFGFLKFFPILKIFIVFLSLIKKRQFCKSDIILAHNFWSDGMVAFLCHIFFGTPYILVVRNTDINVFIPKLRHYRWLMKFLIKKSNGLIFVNKKYMESFEYKYPNLFRATKNISFIPNGVNDFWIKKSRSNLNYSRENNLIFVGAFNENKNIKRIILSVESCLKKDPTLKLMLVGGTKEELKLLMNYKEIPSFINVLGKINSMEILKELYQQSKIFIMPSYFETFGLVYIEALLQGCSIIHSKGQGIDGIFNEDFIKAVNPDDVNEISLEVEYLLNNFENKSNDLKFYQDLKIMFDWGEIADHYIKVCKV